MASVFQRVPHPLVGPDRHPHVDPTPSEHWYDRSSLDVAAVVTIEDQTEEDFFRYAPENRFCEFIDGVVYMPSPVSIRHQELVFFLLSLLAGYRDERGGGTVMMGPAVLRVVPGRDLEPDIFVTPPGARPLPPGGLAFGQADLVIEVLSPSNRSHDLNRKRTVYQEAGIPEVWFVDDRDKVLIVDRREADSDHNERRSEGALASAALPGFWIDVAWLWDDPLPNRRRCLETILAGTPV